jgi:hypothetical protein
LGPERFSARKCNKLLSLHSGEWHAACIDSKRERKKSVRYRINDPTIAMFQVEGGYVARTMSSGTIVDVCNEAIDGDRLVDVIWDGRKVMMFTQDLRSRAEPL